MQKKRIVRPLEIKSLDDNNGIFEGYGAVFGNIDSYGDIIVHGAFKKYLSMNKPSNVKLLWQHNSDEPIGVYDDIQEDENGLYVKGRLLINDIEKSAECYALLKAGAISGLSIGYTVNANGSKYEADGNRYLSDLNLWEISVVTFPANPEANINAVKNMTIKDFERLLRDAGFSKSQAKRIASQGFKSNNRCDAEDAELAKLLEELNELNQIMKG